MRSTNKYTMRKLELRITRALFRLAGPIFPGAFGRLGLYLWGHTHRPPWRTWEHDILQSAKRADLTIGQENIASYCWGDSERSVLLIHGWNSRASHFRNLIPRLRKNGFRIIGFDAIGHGHSSGHWTGIKDYLAAIHAIHDYYGAFHSMIGHSFGGLCIPVAIAEGIHTEKAVILCAPDNLQWLFERFIHTLRLNRDIRYAMAKLTENRIGVDCWKKYSVSNKTSELAHIPALLIYDRDDPAISVQTGQSYAAAWPGSELIITDGLGHHRVLRDKKPLDRISAFIQGD